MSEPIKLKFTTFKPLPSQMDILRLIDRHNYSESAIDILGSGSIGSSKTAVLCHALIRHIVKNDGARALIGRRKMPDVRKTILKEIVEHMGDDFIEDVHYSFNRSIMEMKFKNGSEIIFSSWYDCDLEKFGSYKLSAIGIEELTENSRKWWGAVLKIRQRLGRVESVAENFSLAVTNPGDPEHEAYEHYIDGAEVLIKDRILKKGNRYTVFSRAEDNPYLHEWYLKDQRKNMTPLMARRMLDGQWVSISGEGIYYCYSEENYSKGSYSVKTHLPINLSWDFNIATGKPLSMCAAQRSIIEDRFDFFFESVVEGFNTRKSCADVIDKGVLDYDVPYYVINGDRAGMNKDTRGNVVDFDIIKACINEYKRKDGKRFERALDRQEAVRKQDGVMKYVIELPSQNPGVRDRHNKMNTYFLNDLGQRRIKVWNCPTLNKAFFRTVLKEGTYTEDDSAKYPYQHIGTAAGYLVLETIRREKINEPINPRLLGGR